MRRARTTLHCTNRTFQGFLWPVHIRLHATLHERRLHLRRQRRGRTFCPPRRRMRERKSRRRPRWCHRGTSVCANDAALAGYIRCRVAFDEHVARCICAFARSPPRATRLFWYRFVGVRAELATRTMWMYASYRLQDNASKRMRLRPNVHCNMGPPTLHPGWAGVRTACV